MNKKPPPSYVAVSDTKPLLKAEQNLQSHGSSPFGTIYVRHTVSTTTQPTTTVHSAAVPTWVGSDVLIYVSVFTMICCGLLPGLVALILSWEARSKKEAGQEGEAKSYTVAAITFNIISILLGVGAIIAVSVHYGV